MSPHPRREALALWQQLDAEYDRYEAAIRILPPAHARIQDDLRRYLCLRCAGFLEQVVYVVLTAYLEQKSGGPILRFAESWFRRAPNLTAEAFKKLIGRFGEVHADKFSAFLTPLRSEALAALLDIRNDVAHGKQSNGLRLQPERYVQLCEDVYEWLVETFLADSVEVIDQSGKIVLTHERVPS